MNEQELLFLTPQEHAKEIAKQIREHRIALEMKQTEFAEHIGMPYPTYQLFERTGKISFISFLSILSAIGKKDLLFKGLVMDDIESLGIQGVLNNKKVKKKERVRSNK